MTTNVIYSWTFKDAKGKPASVPVYGTFDEATVTLAQLMAYASTTLLKLDPLTEGQATQVAITLFPSLPSSGIKTAPVAGSDVEETGLLTYQLTSPLNRSFGQDIPAFTQSKFTNGVITLTDTEVIAWRDQMLNHTTYVVPSNEYWASTLNALLRGVKSFRKLGRKAKRF